jgi:hypothetical protein
VKPVVIAFPPFDFPIYGLDATWTGPRWLDFFEGEAAGPSWAAWLGHGHDVERVAGRDWAIIGSFPRKEYSEVVLASGEKFEHGLAFVATHVLFNQSTDVAARLDTEPERWQAWPTVSWTVDGQEVDAHLLQHDLSWAAFCTGLTGVGLVVHASGLDPNGLALVSVTESQVYHFAHDQQLDYPDVLLASQLAALG